MAIFFLTAGNFRFDGNLELIYPPSSGRVQPIFARLILLIFSIHFLGDGIFDSFGVFF